MAGEEDTGEDKDDYEYVTEAYGAVSRSAKVTKHVSRVQLLKTGLSWNEDLLVRRELTELMISLIMPTLFRLMMKAVTAHHPWRNLNPLADLSSRPQG